MCGDKENKKKNCNCIGDIICKIIHLQRNSFSGCSKGGCDKPFLGPEDITCYNTRPVSFYNCTNGELWSVSNSTIFRLESLEDCCCTCRVLNFNNGDYTATNELFTINLNCVCAIKCYQDINLAL